MHSKSWMVCFVRCWFFPPREMEEKINIEIEKTTNDLPNSNKHFLQRNSCLVLIRNIPS